MADNEPDPSKNPLPGGASGGDITKDRTDPNLPTYQVGEFSFPACPAGTDPALAAGIGQYLETDAVKNFLLGQIQSGLMKAQHAAGHMPPGDPTPTPSRNLPPHISARTMAQNQQAQGQHAALQATAQYMQNLNYQAQPLATAETSWPLQPLYANMNQGGHVPPGTVAGDPMIPHQQLTSWFPAAGQPYGMPVGLAPPPSVPTYSTTYDLFDREIPPRAATSLSHMSVDPTPTPLPQNPALQEENVRLRTEIEALRRNGGGNNGGNRTPGGNPNHTAQSMQIESPEERRDRAREKEMFTRAIQNALKATSPYNIEEDDFIEWLECTFSRWESAGIELDIYKNDVNKQQQLKRLLYNCLTLDVPGKPKMNKTYLIGCNPSKELATASFKDYHDRLITKFSSPNKQMEAQAEFKTRKQERHEEPSAYAAAKLQLWHKANPGVDVSLMPVDAFLESAINGLINMEVKRELWRYQTIPLNAWVSTVQNAAYVVWKMFFNKINMEGVSGAGLSIGKRATLNTSLSSRQQMVAAMNEFTLETMDSNNDAADIGLAGVEELNAADGDINAMKEYSRSRGKCFDCGSLTHYQNSPKCNEKGARKFAPSTPAFKKLTYQPEGEKTGSNAFLMSSGNSKKGKSYSSPKSGAKNKPSGGRYNNNKKKVRYVQIVEEEESSDGEDSGKEEEEDERVETVGHVSEPASCYGWTSEDETLLHQTIFGITPLTTPPPGPNQEEEREEEKCKDNEAASPPPPLPPWLMAELRRAERRTKVQCTLASPPPPSSAGKSSQDTRDRIAKNLALWEPLSRDLDFETLTTLELDLELTMRKHGLKRPLHRDSEEWRKKEEELRAKGPLLVIDKWPTDVAFQVQEHANAIWPGRQKQHAAGDLVDHHEALLREEGRKEANKFLDTALQVTEKDELDSPPDTEDERDMSAEDDVEMLDLNVSSPNLIEGLDIEKPKNPDGDNRDSLHTPVLEIDNANDDDIPGAEEETVSNRPTTKEDQTEETEDVNDNEQDPSWEPPRKTSPDTAGGCVTRGASGATANPRPPPELIPLELQNDDEVLPITPPPDETLMTGKICPPRPTKRDATPPRKDPAAKTTCSLYRPCGRCGPCYIERNQGNVPNLKKALHVAPDVNYVMGRTALAIKSLWYQEALDATTFQRFESGVDLEIAIGKAINLMVEKLERPNAEQTSRSETGTKPVETKDLGKPDKVVELDLEKLVDDLMDNLRGNLQFTTPKNTIGRTIEILETSLADLNYEKLPPSTVNACYWRLRREYGLHLTGLESQHAREMKEQNRVQTQIIERLTKQKESVEGTLCTSRRVRKNQYDEIQKMKTEQSQLERRLELSQKETAQYEERNKWLWKNFTKNQEETKQQQLEARQFEAKSRALTEENDRLKKKAQKADDRWKVESNRLREKTTQARNSQAKADDLDKQLQAAQRQLKQQEGGVTENVARKCSALLTDTVRQMKQQEEQLKKELNEVKQQLHTTHSHWKRMALTATNIAKSRDEVTAERNLLRQCMPEGHFGKLLTGSSTEISNATELRKIPNTGRLALLGQPDGIEDPERRKKFLENLGIGNEAENFLPDSIARKCSALSAFWAEQARRWLNCADYNYQPLVSRIDLQQLEDVKVEKEEPEYVENRPIYVDPDVIDLTMRATVEIEGAVEIADAPRDIKDEAAGAAGDPLQILEEFCENLENRILPDRDLPVEMREQRNPVDYTQGNVVSSSNNAVLPHTEQDDVSSSTNAVLPDPEPVEVEMEAQSFQ